MNPMRLLVPAALLVLWSGCERPSEPAPSAATSVQVPARPTPTPTSSTPAARPGAASAAASAAPRPAGPKVSVVAAFQGKKDLSLRLALERDGDEVRGFLVSDSANTGTHLAGKMLDERRFRLTEVGKRKHSSALEGELDGAAVSKVLWNEGKGKIVALSKAPLVPFGKGQESQESGYAGAIGQKLQVRAQLKREGKALSGYYRYARSRDDLKLQGSVEPGTGKFELRETGPKGTFTGKMRGTFLNASHLVGVWESADGARSMPLWLSFAQPLPKILELPGGGKVIPREQEARLAPHCTRSRTSPELDGLASKKAQDALNKEFSRPLVFPADKELCEGATADLPYSFDEGYAVTSSKRKGLLGVELSSYEFTGGAHPNGATSCLVLDTEQGRRIDLHTLLAEGALDKLSALATRKLKEEHKVTDLTEAGFFDQEIKVSKEPNLCLQDDHLTLVFSAYEVGPYAMGAPEVTLSFAELKPLMKKDPLVDALLR
jgi:hypothetical protein